MVSYQVSFTDWVPRQVTNDSNGLSILRHFVSVVVDRLIKEGIKPIPYPQSLD